MRTSTLLQAALAASGPLVLAQDAPPEPSAEEQALADHLELYWSYGRSPPVYPTPEMNGAGGWAESLEYAREFVSQMSNDEKNNITYG